MEEDRQYNKFTRLVAIGPFKLVSHEIPNCHTGRQETYWGKENTELTSFIMVIFKYPKHSVFVQCY